MVANPGDGSRVVAIITRDRGVVPNQSRHRRGHSIGPVCELANVCCVCSPARKEGTERTNAAAEFLGSRIYVCLPLKSLSRFADGGPGGRARAAPVYWDGGWPIPRDRALSTTGLPGSRAKVPALVGPELSCCTSSGRAWQLWTGRHAQGEGQATERPATAVGARASS